VVVQIKLILKPQFLKNYQFIKVYILVNDLFLISGIIIKPQLLKVPYGQDKSFAIRKETVPNINN